MLRVGDINRSIDFYTRVLGMKVLRSLEQPKEKYSLTFLGFNDELNEAVLELTYNYGVTQYDMGNSYGHIAISVDNCYAACDEIETLGGNIIYKAGPLPGTSEVIAFVTDPDGYQIELVQRPI